MSSQWPLPSSQTPWRWQCHNCRTWYALSCTRRCLRCSHVFCQKRHHSSIDALSSPHLRRQAKSKPRKNKKTGTCGSEFDFEGWAAWGSWRRMTVIKRLSTRQHEDEQDRGETQPRRQDTRKRAQRKEMEKNAYLTWKPKGYSRGRAHFPKNWFPRFPQTQAAVLKRKEEMYLRGDHDCSLHCDYPNECGYAILAAKEREAAEVDPSCN
jgi:hypothetical protein